MFLVFHFNLENPNSVSFEEQKFLFPHTALEILSLLPVKRKMNDVITAW